MDGDGALAAELERELERELLGPYVFSQQQVGCSRTPLQPHAAPAAARHWLAQGFACRAAEAGAGSHPFPIP